MTTEKTSMETLSETIDRTFIERKCKGDHWKGKDCKLCNGEGIIREYTIAATQRLYNELLKTIDCYYGGGLKSQRLAHALIESSARVLNPSEHIFHGEAI
jgi:hypothetical protein